MDSRAVPPLVDALAAIPDFRAARGKRHGLRPTLLPVCVATRCGARSQTAIAAWGEDDGPPWPRRLGFTRDEGLSQSTLHRLFTGVLSAAVEAARRGWAEQVMARAAPGGLEGVAIDGKTLRGSKQRGAADTPLRCALRHRLGDDAGAGGGAGQDRRDRGGRRLPAPPGAGGAGRGGGCPADPARAGPDGAGPRRRPPPRGRGQPDHAALGDRDAVQRRGGPGRHHGGGGAREPARRTAGDAATGPT